VKAITFPAADNMNGFPFFRVFHVE
jgi:hypothetical protein